MAGSNDSVQIKIAVIEQGDRGNAKNRTIDWKDLRSRLSRPTIDQNHTVEQYFALSVDRKNKLKDVGSFVLGFFEGGIRKRENIHFRSGIALDIDATNADQVEHLRMGLSKVCQYEFFGYTTRSHTEEAQRWRLVFPVAEPVPAEEYTPASRILASKLLPSLKASMDATDDVSFRVAQVMYWPSINKDGEFDTFRNTGRLLDHTELLESFGPGWEDWTQLPYSDKHGQKRPSGLKKAEHPHSKRGTIGAFCRAYDIPAAIEKFIPEIYKRGSDFGSKPRYTYTKGSGANGAIVEDKGLFLYSHHSSDPCGERLVNAWDMVRLHLYSHLDADTKDDVSPGSRPSFKAMTEHLSDDVKVVRELQAEQYDIDAMFEDLGDPDAEEGAEAPPKKSNGKATFDDLLGSDPEKSNWMKRLDIDNMGLIKPTLTNVALILQNDPRLKGLVALNKFTGEMVAQRTLSSRMDVVPVVKIRDALNGDHWEDRHDIAVRAIIEAPAGKGKSGYGLRVTDRDLVGAVHLAGQKHAIHPVKDYLRGLEWDGEERVDSFFVRHLGCPDTEYHRQVARLVLVAAVTRIHEPGHKFDFAAILEGKQGKRKSTFIRVMARDRWFNELNGDVSDAKKMVEQMMGYWIMELPELAGIHRSEVNDVKAFLSRQTDTPRLAWAKRAAQFRRQCIFLGSTNDRKYLKDETGNRRMWPVIVTKKHIDIRKVDDEMDQVWAEAVAIYDDMRADQPHGELPLYLTGQAADIEATQAQELRRVDSADETIAGRISEWLDEKVALPVLLGEREGFEDLDRSKDTMVRRTRVCLAEIWVDCLKRDLNTYSSIHSQALGRAMNHVDGWVASPQKCRVPKYGQQRVYLRTSTHLGSSIQVGYEKFFESDLLG